MKRAINNRTRDVQKVIKQIKLENKAIENIKENPKYFYSYTKHFSKARVSIGPFLTPNGEIISDNAAMADMLTDHY